MLTAGCGGSGSGGVLTPLDPARSAITITQSPTLDQVKAALAQVGKPLPDFLGGGAVAASAIAPADQVSPASYMTVLTLGHWLNYQSVAYHRVQWYECQLNNLSNLTDVYVYWRSGDPDLYVFSPLRTGTPKNSLRLIGFSAKDGAKSEQVGSFTAGPWNGAGRFVIAVYGYATSSYDVKIW
jgi:hypothetical protein